MKWFRRRRNGRPLWAEEFSVQAADERYVNRRQLAKFLVLTSFGMFVGNCWILLRRWLHEGEEAHPMKVIGRLSEIPVGGHLLFEYPTAHDHCILVRPDERTLVAYSQKCTHLACAVYYSDEEQRLVCPCHEGFFAIADGRPVQGPPARPLPRIELAVSRGRIIATGVDLQTGA